MSGKLGIFVSSDRHLDHLLGIARAAHQAGKELTVFLTHRGVLLTREPAFAQLEGLALVSLCQVNFSAWGLRRPVPGVAEEDFASQARHAAMIAGCDRYIVL
ncbi:MAG: hypothetical protein HY910_07965 [Desulfarculus sp.]|nr:hypothetical protein [Desulfarculus sp.]